MKTLIFLNNIYTQYNVSANYGKNKLELFLY